MGLSGRDKRAMKGLMMVQNLPAVAWLAGAFGGVAGIDLGGLGSFIKFISFKPC